MSLFQVAFEKTKRVPILKNPLITDWSETSISHGDDGDGRSIDFVRAMFFIQ
jgi:hypothetical protein